MINLESYQACTISTSIEILGLGNDVHDFFALDLYMTVFLISFAALYRKILDKFPNFPTYSKQSSHHLLILNYTRYNTDYRYYFINYMIKYNFEL